MQTISEVTNCCGCKACVQVCPKGCITIKKDSEGFDVPSIVDVDCIKCGKCYKACAQTGYEWLHTVKNTYAALHQNHDVLMNSTSGGGMTSIAEQVLGRDGVVFGTILDTSDWRAKYVRIDDMKNLGLLRGSKYVQSDTGDVYSLVKKELRQDREVMFIGVPCQVAGLYKYLGNNQVDNLITIDILCHGTPSPTLFQEHVSYIEKKYRAKLTNFMFRDKAVFPNKTALRYEFGNKKKYILGRCEPYFNAFISGSAYRMCCYECQYATSKRVGDITLGDYWGVKQFHPEFDNSNGVSLILVNTEKGNQYLNKAKLTLVQSKLSNAIVGNGILKGPSPKAQCRERFYKDVSIKGYENAIKDNIKNYPMIYNFILTHMPHGLVKILSRI